MSCKIGYVAPIWAAVWCAGMSLFGNACSHTQPTVVVPEPLSQSLALTTLCVNIAPQQNLTSGEATRFFVYQLNAAAELVELPLLSNQPLGDGVRSLHVNIPAISRNHVDLVLQANFGQTVRLSLLPQVNPTNDCLMVQALDEAITLRTEVFLAAKAQGLWPKDMPQYWLQEFLSADLARVATADANHGHVVHVLSEAITAAFVSQRQVLQHPVNHALNSTQEYLASVAMASSFSRFSRFLPEPVQAQARLDAQVLQARAMKYWVLQILKDLKATSAEQQLANESGSMLLARLQHMPRHSASIQADSLTIWQTYDMQLAHVLCLVGNGKQALPGGACQPTAKMIFRPMSEAFADTTEPTLIAEDMVWDVGDSIGRMVEDRYKAQQTLLADTADFPCPQPLLDIWAVLTSI